jgi:hypothetical protein
MDEKFTGLPSWQLFLQVTNVLKHIGVTKILIPNKKEFSHRCGQENRVVKEAWERWSPAK